MRIEELGSVQSQANQNPLGDCEVESRLLESQTVCSFAAMLPACLWRVSTLREVKKSACALVKL